MLPGVAGSRESSPSPAKGARPLQPGELLARGDTTCVTPGALCHQVRENQCYKLWESAKIPTYISYCWLIECLDGKTFTSSIENMRDFFLHRFWAFVLFCPQQPCSTADHWAAMQGAAGQLRALLSGEMPWGRAPGCVHVWDRFGFCSHRSSYSYSIGKLTGPKTKETRWRLEEFQQGRRAAVRDFCITLSCPKAAAAPVPWAWPCGLTGDGEEEGRGGSAAAFRPCS